VSAERPRADLLDAVFVLARHWPRVWQVPGVPEASATVVRCFRGDVDRLTVGDVARILAVAPSTASRLVSAATGSGHVTKAPTAGSPRFVAVRLTRLGADLLDRLVAAERDAIAAATPAWTARRRWQARGVLLELADGLAGGPADASAGGPPVVVATEGPPEGIAVSAG
jgi:DNA-binding MarR family transcriptional regulator